MKPIVMKKIFLNMQTNLNDVMLSSYLFQIN